MADPDPSLTPPSDQRDRTTGLLYRLCGGEPSSAMELFPVVYDQLRGIAEQLLLRERSGHTLQATALVNEAFLRLVDVDRLGAAGDSARQHFLALAARAMRRILVDHARGRGRDKRGGDLARITLDESMDAPTSDGVDVIDLEAALERLQKIDPRLVQAAELRLFGGLSVAEMGACMGMSLTRAKVLWTSARVMLQKLLGT